MSGSNMGPWGPINANDALAYSRKVMKRHNCNTVEEFRNLPFHSLWNLRLKNFTETIPCVDG